MKITDLVQLKKVIQLKLGTEYTVTDSAGKSITFITSISYFGDEDEFGKIALGEKFILSGQIDSENNSVLYSAELISTEFPGK